MKAAVLSKQPPIAIILSGMRAVGTCRWRHCRLYLLVRILLHTHKSFIYTLKFCESCQQRLRTAVPQQRASHLGADPRHECAPTAEVGVLQPVQQMEAGTIATSWSCCTGYASTHCSRSEYLLSSTCDPCRAVIAGRGIHTCKPTTSEQFPPIWQHCICVCRYHTLSRTNSWAHHGVAQIYGRGMLPTRLVIFLKHYLMLR